MKKVKVGNEEIELDESHVKFTLSEDGINEYLTNFSGWYDYYASKLNLAELIYNTLNDDSEELYYKKYIEHKTNGGTDKLCEAQAKSEPDVVSLQKRARLAKYTLDQLKSHIRSMDKSHVSILNICYNMRKEMGVFNTNFVKDNSINDLEQKVAKIIK